MSWGEEIGEIARFKTDEASNYSNPRRYPMCQIHFIVTLFTLGTPARPYSLVRWGAHLRTGVETEIKQPRAINPATLDFTRFRLRLFCSEALGSPLYSGFEIS